MVLYPDLDIISNPNPNPNLKNLFLTVSNYSLDQLKKRIRSNTLLLFIFFDHPAGIAPVPLRVLSSSNVLHFGCDEAR